MDPKGDREEEVKEVKELKKAKEPSIAGLAGKPSCCRDDIAPADRDRPKMLGSVQGIENKEAYSSTLRHGERGDSDGQLYEACGQLEADWFSDGWSGVSSAS